MAETAVALTVTIGAPGSGKSTWAAQQQARVVSTDALRAVTDDRRAIGEFFEWAFGELRESLTHGEAVILDSCAVNRRIRQQAIEAARAADVRAIAVVFDTDLETCCDAQRERAHPVPIGMVRSMHAAVTDITDARLRAEGFDDVRHVRRGDAPASVLHRSVPALHSECRSPLCGRYAHANGFCVLHQDRQRAQSAPTPGTNLSPANRRFRRARHSYLVRHPMCAMCRREPAGILDHIVPHRGMPQLFWDQENWQGLCIRCHGIKTARETWHGN